MDRETALDYSLLATRLLVAFIFLWHGLPKALDPAFAAEKFVEFGLPGWLGPTTGAVEVVAGALLALGLGGRWAAAALGVIIVGALITVQLPGGFSAGLERDLLIFLATVLLVSQGTGALSVDAVLGRAGR